MIAGAQLLTLGSVRCILLVDGIMTLLVLVDAWAGHFRRGFAHPAQYAPFPVGALLAVCTIIAGIAPRARGVEQAVRASGWLAICAGLVGFCLHHYYGVARKPGGYRRILDSVMYGAPPLAPLALSLVGAFALVAYRGLIGAGEIGGLPLRTALLGAMVIGLCGAILQAGLLHFRGAFNQALMYLPLTVPVLAVMGGVWMIFQPGAVARVTLAGLLWLTLMSGFVGLGMHLRGFDRQMAGLYVPLFNWLQGPPAFAPAVFAGLAAIGLVAIARP
jgi:hypothetical protein